MTLAPPDYVVLALAAGGAITGIFIGLSGALAFFSGCLAASFAATFGWRFFASFISSGLARGLAVALAALVAFWIARAIVRKTVKVALAQPGDSILGALAAGISGFAVYSLSNSSNDLPLVSGQRRHKKRKAQKQMAL